MIKSFRLTDEALRNLVRIATFTDLSESKIINLLLTQPAIVNGEVIDESAASWVITQYFRSKVETD